MRLNIAEIRKPELDAQLVADSIAQQIEKRVMFRRAMKRAVMSTMRSGALGVKVRVSGRLNGSEIARTEWYREGRIPLHTFRADIDYGLSEAQHHLRRHRRQGAGSSRARCSRSRGQRLSCSAAEPRSGAAAEKGTADKAARGNGAGDGSGSCPPATV